MFSIRWDAATEAASAIYFTLRCSIAEAPTSSAQRSGTQGSVQKRSKDNSETKTHTNWPVPALSIADEPPGFTFAFSVKPDVGQLQPVAWFSRAQGPLLLDIDWFKEDLPTEKRTLVGLWPLFQKK